MTLEEAAKELIAELQTYKRENRPLFYDAVKIGIEALKCVERMRSLYTSGFSKLLPGETEG